MKFRLTFSLLLLFFVLIQKRALTQSFLYSSPNEQKSFKQMQKKFNDWSSVHQLNQEKGWKRYKRWEYEMLFHTNGKGEPGDEILYQSELIKNASVKSSAKNSGQRSIPDWTPTGPVNLPDNLTGYMENGQGRINCIAFHPSNPNIYWVGVAQGGLWKTINNGLTWTVLTDDLPITRISDICVDPNNTDILYISVCDFEYIDVALNIDGRKRHTHYGLGVYKSTDGGITWQATGLSFNLTNKDNSLIRKILVNPLNSSQLVACGVSGMFTSNNSGTTWNQVLDSLIWDMVQDPINPGVLYASGGWLYNSNKGYAGIYKSTNFGNSWSLLSTGIPGTGTVQRIKLAIAPSDPNYVYALAVDIFEGAHGFYKSTNAGLNWQMVNNSQNVLGYDDGTGAGGQGTYDMALAVNRQDKNIIYTGGINVWVSLNGGSTFDPASHWTLNYGNTIHGDIHFIDVQPVSNQVFVCSDGGVYRTASLLSQTWADAYLGNPWPTVWTKINDGLQITSFYRLSSSKNTDGRLAAGAQDNATFYYDGALWSTIFGGDGMDNFINPNSPSMVIGSSQYGNFYVSVDDGWSDFGAIVNVNAENGEWVSPLICDPSNYSTLYAGFTGITESDDDGFNWYSLNPPPSNGIFDNEISALAVSPVDGNLIYAARRVRLEYGSPGNLYRTDNHANSWIDVTAGLPDSLYITSVEAYTLNADIVYVSVAGLSPGLKVFKSVNRGNTWSNISFNLPNVPVNMLKCEPITGTLLAATDLGIFAWDNQAQVWNNLSQGLPNVIVSDIEFNHALNKIYVSTFGRGIWENNLNMVVGMVSNNENLNPNIRVFPSIGNGDLIINRENDWALNDVNLSVIDVSGKVVYSASLQAAAKNDLHVSASPGVYFVQISQADKYFNQKIVIK